MQAGATGILYNRTLSADQIGRLSKKAWLIEVPDTTVAMRAIAAAWRREFRIPVVGIGGSAGKTTTKELLASILRGKFKQILKTQGSQNGFLGIPMTLMELSPDHGVAVIEIGIDEIGAMKQHVGLVAPDFSVLTSIGPEHLEKLVDVPTVAREEGILLQETLGNGGSVCVSLDDSWIAGLKLPAHRRRMHFTLLPESDSAIECIRGSWNADLGEMEISGLGEMFVLRCPLEGRHNASNLLAAVSVALLLGLTADEITAGLQTFHAAAGRSELKQLPNGTRVLCDYYNANPSSMVAAFELISAKTGGALIACLGDMLELGTQEESFHRGLAESLIANKFSNILLFGPKMKWLEDEFKKRKFTGECHWFENKSDLSAHLKKTTQPGDRVLIKGSRGMRMEEVWESVFK